MKIIGEDKTMEQRTQDLFQEWEKEKPVQVDPSFFPPLSLLSVLGKSFCSSRLPLLTFLTELTFCQVISRGSGFGYVP